MSEVLYVQFNPLVTASIEVLTFRQFDYETLMSYSCQLSRWLHKRLYHNYVNAEILNTYHFLLKSVKRDSGLLNNERISQDMKYLEQTLEELNRTSGRIQTETYGFARQRTRGWPRNLILISCMSFLVDF